MQLSIKLRLALGAEHYDVNLDLPGTVPQADAPFLFGVEQFKNKVKEKEEDPDVVDETSGDKLLQVAIGGSEYIYVAVKPPKSLIAAAKVDKVVENLEVLAAQGEYLPEEKKFKTA